MERLLERDSLLGMVTGPIVWAVYFVFVYSFMSIGCAVGFADTRLAGASVVNWILGLASVLTLLFMAYRSLLAWRDLRAARRTRAAAEDALQEQRGFMAATALFLYGLSVIATLWVAWPILVFHPCQ